MKDVNSRNVKGCKMGSLYEDLKNDINNFSYWFPKVKDCGIKVPESVIVDVPEDTMRCFFMERKDDYEKIEKFVKDSVMPALDGLPTLLFMKNGVFSNKFSYRTCAVRKDFHEIIHNMIDINYQSLCFDAGGNTEMIFRERIGWGDSCKSYRIYGGLPLRPEFRVFYDFDEKRPLYCVNYWDWDYCHDRISADKTDKIVYEAAYEELDKFYKENRDKVMELVGEKMKNVSDMSGRWSVDIMWCDDDYWLIDMAIAQTSAYYDESKIGGAK